MQTICTVQTELNQKKKLVENWLQKQYQKITKENLILPVYSSFDVRDAGFKAAIVDSNLFPAGFNNLDEHGRKKAVEVFKKYLNLFSSREILIIPENHTRNLFYLRHLNILKKLIEEAGFKVTIGSLREDITDNSLEVKDAEDEMLVLEKMQRKGNKIITKSFQNGLILLNNDFSQPNPPLLDDVQQMIIPPLTMGWTHRKKGVHFNYFDCLIEEFAELLEIDPWLLSTIHQEVHDVHFQEKESLIKIAEGVEKVLGAITQKYKEHQIKQQPYVFVKDNSGTYGMGILTVTSGKEIMELNSDKRRKMLFGKEKSTITSVLIQEGIRTIHAVDGKNAEPVIYSVGGQAIGGFMRVHDAKDSEGNLNVPGMKFDMLFRNNITRPLLEDSTELSLYSVLAAIANIAIAYEYQHKSPCGDVS